MSKAMIFDMDGTIFKTEKILEKAILNTIVILDDKNISLVDNPLEKYNEIMGVPLEEVWKSLLVNPTDEKIVVSNDLFQRELIKLIIAGEGELYSHASELLESIKKLGYSIFIASNGDKEYLNTIVDYYELRHFIDGVYSINDIEEKDKTLLVKHIIHQENISLKYLVGDRMSDFKAAEENGVKSIGCEFYYSKEKELQKSDMRVSRLMDIIEIIN